MLGQLNQLWEQEAQTEELTQLIAVGRYIAATELEEDDIKDEMTSWLDGSTAPSVKLLVKNGVSNLKERLFGI